VRLFYHLSFFLSYYQSLNLFQQTLNKAISKLSNTIRNKVTPVETTTELQGSVQFADDRLVNLEKAVTQLHRRQNNLKASVDSSSTQSQNASSLANMESRLLILEKAVTRLHHRQMKAKDDTPVVVSSVTSEYKSQDNELAVISAADAASQTVENTPTVENIPKPLEVAAASAQPESIFQTNLEKLEKIVQQMSSLQPTTRSVYQSGTGTTSGDTTRTNSSLQVRHLERTLNQLDLRLDILERREQEQEVVVDQLFEIRDHIDSLLNGIE